MHAPHVDGRTMQLQISRTKTRFACSEQDRVHIRHLFDETHVIRLPQFFDAELFADVRQLIEGAELVASEHDVGHEVIVASEEGKALIEFLLNDDVLFEAVDTLTGCGHIGCFSGRIYSLRAEANEEFDWHSDLVQDRLLAISVNLGREPYEGGVLEIADRATRTVQQRVLNTAPGDAVLFRLSPELVHRVTPVLGMAPKIAWAGWFRSRPSYHRVLARLDDAET